MQHRQLHPPPDWLVERILDFVNRAQDADELTGTLADAPKKKAKISEERGYAISETVAQGILEVRNQLPDHRFSNTDQLMAVPGFGEEKLLDLCKHLWVPAAKQFHDAMFEQVLSQDNWELTYHTYDFDSHASFLDIATNESNFTEWVSERVEEISFDKYGNSQAAYLASLLIPKCYLELFDDSLYGSLALAFWLYQFDADNWFTFEEVHQQTEQYLSIYPNWEDRLELRLFKGFENVGVLVTGVAQNDLPVVVNFAEEVITIWTGQLND
jgi:hypothetical protein